MWLFGFWDVSRLSHSSLHSLVVWSFSTLWDELVIILFWCNIFFICIDIISIFLLPFAYCSFYSHIVIYTWNLLMFVFMLYFWFIRSPIPSSPYHFDYFHLYLSFILFLHFYLYFAEHHSDPLPMRSMTHCLSLTRGMRIYHWVLEPSFPLFLLPLT